MHEDNSGNVEVHYSSWDKCVVVEDRKSTTVIFSVTAKYLVDFDNVNKNLEFDGCPYLFKPGYTDTVRLQTEEWMMRQRNGQHSEEGEVEGGSRGWWCSMCMKRPDNAKGTEKVSFFFRVLSIML